MDKLVTVVTFTFPSQGYLANSYLQANGIETFLKDEMTVQVKNFNSMAVGGLKIQVRESDYDTAYNLLVSGGYIVLEKSQPNLPIVEKFDKLTSSLPILKYLNLEARIILTVGLAAILVLAIVIVAIEH